jgi:zinc protease
LGIDNREVPLVQFQVQIKGAMLLENADKIGVSNMLADLMTKGTKKTGAIRNAIESLGATIRAYA